MHYPPEAVLAGSHVFVLVDLGQEESLPPRPEVLLVPGEQLLHLPHAHSLVVHGVGKEPDVVPDGCEVPDGEAVHEGEVPAVEGGPDGVGYRGGGVHDYGEVGGALGIDQVSCVLRKLAVVPDLVEALYLEISRLDDLYHIVLQWREVLVQVVEQLGSDDGDPLALEYLGGLHRGVEVPHGLLPRGQVAVCVIDPAGTGGREIGPDLLGVPPDLPEVQNLAVDVLEVQLRVLSDLSDQLQVVHLVVLQDPVGEQPSEMARRDGEDPHAHRVDPGVQGRLQRGVVGDDEVVAADLLV